MNSRAASDSFPRTFFAPACAQFVRILNHRCDSNSPRELSESKVSTALIPFEPEALAELVPHAGPQNSLNESDLPAAC